MGRARTVLMALLVALGVTSAALLGSAEAKRKKGKSIAGKYVGLTEENGTVSFKLTRSGQVLNFKLTDATLYCVTEPTNVNPTYFPDRTALATITHAPMRTEKVTKKNPQGKRFEVSDPIYEDRAHDGSDIKGAIASLTSGPGGGRVTGTGFSGEVAYGSTTGPVDVPGTEICATKYVDWEAKRPGSKGFVADAGSGHGKPPLSEF